MSGRPISGRSRNDRQPVVQARAGDSAAAVASSETTTAAGAISELPPVLEGSLNSALAGVVMTDVCLGDDDQLRAGEARHRIAGHHVLEDRQQPFAVLL